jgi:hypothetical protein
MHCIKVVLNINRFRVYAGYGTSSRYIGDPALRRQVKSCVNGAAQILNQPRSFSDAESGHRQERALAIKETCRLWMTSTCDIIETAQRHHHEVMRVRNPRSSLPQTVRRLHVMLS